MRSDAGRSEENLPVSIQCCCRSRRRRTTVKWKDFTTHSSRVGMVRGGREGFAGAADRVNFGQVFQRGLGVPVAGKEVCVLMLSGTGGPVGEGSAGVGGGSLRPGNKSGIWMG